MCLRFFLTALTALAISAVAQPIDEMAALREAMVADQIEARGVADSLTLAAMRAVPRDEFVRSADRDRAYGDHPIPIGHGQTISQPFIVAFMTDLLNLEPGDRVLEVGTGSGYQAAVLAEITDDVFSVEIIPALAERVDLLFEELGLDQITRRQSDGFYGWEEHAPFDAIIVTAAASHVPPALIEQLADDGRLIIPVGGTPWSQNLVMVTKDGDAVRTRTLIPVRFVPLTGEH